MDNVVIGVSVFIILVLIFVWYKYYGPGCASCKSTKSSFKTCVSQGKKKPPIYVDSPAYEDVNMDLHDDETSHPEKFMRAEQEAMTRVQDMDNSDYNSYIKSQALDLKTVTNHQAWATEMAPFSGTATKIQEFDPGLYVDFRGLRRPQAIPQSKNAMFVTELGPNDFANNKPFNFNNS